jgi:SAM-dependent methyltransferase/uncharacterized protein YbaR (Trm112 family)
MHHAGREANESTSLFKVLFTERYLGVGRSTLKYRLLKWLACPGCRSTSLSLDTIRTETQPILPGAFSDNDADQPGLDRGRGEEQTVVEGAISCDDCGVVYPIRDGVPRMIGPGRGAGPSTRHRHTAFDAGVPEWEENFLDLAAPLRPDDFLGKLVLDAGCGFGRHAYFAARYGAEVIALDTSADAVESTVRNTAQLNRVHVVEGDIHRSPFRDEIFDLTYAFGVLHHLDEPQAAFRALGRTVRAGGRLSLFVYGPRQGITLRANNGLRSITTDLNSEQLEGVSKGIARALRIFSHTPYRLLQHTPIARSIVSHLPVHDHHRWSFEVVVADVYDRLRIPVKHWFTGEQLEAWLADDGYADVKVSRRVRNNETFRATGLRR